MDLTASEQPKPVTRQLVEAQDRTLPGKVTGKLKRALDAMVWDGLQRDKAAQAANMSIHGLREALKRTHVRQYYKQQINLLRESEHARNVHRLAEIRDAGNNMPAVQAIGMLERLRSESEGSSASAGHSPGLTIRIINQQPTQPMIDVTPMSESMGSNPIDE